MVEAVVYTTRVHDWETKVAFMRQVGATEASWDGDTLVSVTLGAAPGTGPKELTEVELQSRRRREQERFRQVALGAAPRLVRRDPYDEDG